MTKPLSAADRQDWNRAAAGYIAQSKQAQASVKSIYQQFRSVLWACLGELRGLTVLDVGCGHGWLCGEMAAAGAQVWGVDGSAALLDHARATFPAIEFTEWDLMAGLPPTERRFDRAVAMMVLMDLPDIGPILAALRRLLKPGGRFIFTLPHPCFFQQKTAQDPASGEWFCKVTSYRQPAVWRIDSFGGHNHYHRDLTYYFEQLRAQGFAVTRFFEPAHDLGSVGPASAFLKQQIPKFLLIEARSYD